LVHLASTAKVYKNKVQKKKTNEISISPTGDNDNLNTRKVGLHSLALGNITLCHLPSQ